MEHSVVRACALAHRDEHQDGPVLEVEAPVRLQVDERLPEQCAWDAWDGARQDAMDVADLHRALAAAGVEKLADQARGVRARAASSRQERRFVQRARPAGEEELCTPDAVRFAERSCAAPEVAAALQAQPDAPELQEYGPAQKHLPKAQAAQPQRLAAALDEAVQEPSARSELSGELQPRAFRRREQPPRVAQRALEPELSLLELVLLREAV